MSAENVLTYPRSSKFRLEDFDTLQPSRTPWRVKGLWPRVGVCFVAGPSMSGKSFRVLDWLACVCRGLPVLGRKSIRAGCVYVASEGAEGVRNRIVGLRARTGSLGSGFQFIGQAADLTSPDDVADLRVTVTEAREAMAVRGAKLGVLAIDTLSASAPGADENSSKDMSPVLSALHALALELQLLIVVIAHTGKDETRGMRGWSGLLANADGVVMIDDPKGQPIRTGTVTKVKDGKAGDVFAFTLSVVEIGQDDDGDPITTCVVDEAEAPETSNPAGQTRLNAAAQMTLSALDRLLAEGQGVLPPPVPGLRPGVEGVTLSTLREKAYAMGLQRADQPGEGAEEVEKKRWLATRKKAFQRAVEKLQEARKVRQEGDWIWSI